jgi:L-lactate dehydrogenase complex protein LldE
MEVDIFIPCFIDQTSPETAINMIKILEKLGVKSNYNPEQSCCGQMAFNSGFWDEAKVLGEKFIHDFSNNRPIVSPSASCMGMVKNHYNKLFHNTSLHNEYKILRENIFEFSDFVVNYLKKEDIGAEFEAKVCYHYSCAAQNEYGLKDEAVRLIKNVKGVEYLEMENPTECCGFGGTFSVKHHAISAAMGEKKVENALKTGADFIISTDSSCLLHQDAYIKKKKLPIKVLHIVDFLAKGIHV